MPEEQRQQFTNEKMTMLMAPCFYCKHLTQLGEMRSNVRWNCKAFPEGIPYMIWSRHVEHNEVLFFQKGRFVYESKVYEWPDGKQKVTFMGDWFLVS